MPSLTELIGGQAAAGAQNIGQNINEGLQAGVKLAGMQQGLEVQRAQQQNLEQDLQQKQATGISNRLQAASFAKTPQQRKILLDGVESVANQTKTPFDRAAFEAGLNDDTTRIALQQGLQDVQAGKIPSTAFLQTIASAPALFDYVNSRAGESAKFDQQLRVENARTERAIRIAQLGAEAKERAAASKASGAQSKGEEAVDKKYAEEYVDWQAKGGAANIIKNLSQLEAPLARLEGGQGSGGVTGLLPKSFNDVLAPADAGIQDDIEGVVQASMKETLGAQFTEKEGVNVLKRAFNPRLSPQENAKRVRRVAANLTAVAQAKQAAADYFQTNGTLTGFKGQTRFDDSSVSKMLLDGVDSKKEAGDTTKTTAPTAAENYLKALPPNADKAKAMAAFQRRVGRQLTAAETALFGAKVAGQ